MRAFLYQAVGGSIDLVDLPDPECPLDGAIVEVRATGVCRSDWHAWRGHDPVPLPMVPGHEFSGVVKAVGPRVRKFRTGDRVTAPFVNGCGTCSFCRSGQAQVCPTQQQPGFTYFGSFAEQVVVHHADTNLVRLPDGLSFIAAASLGCRFATAFHALTSQAGLVEGEQLAVFGAGGVGLSAVLIAAAIGAQIVVVDPSPAARAQAEALGAGITLADATPAEIERATAGGAHVSLDAVGSTRTTNTAVRSLRRRGRHVQVGLMFGPDATAPLPWDLLVAREWQIIGSHGMAAVDYPRLFVFIDEHGIQPEKLVGTHIDFVDLGRTLMAMDDPPAQGGLTVATLRE